MTDHDSTNPTPAPESDQDRVDNAAELSPPDAAFQPPGSDQTATTPMEPVATAPANLGTAPAAAPAAVPLAAVAPAAPESASAAGPAAPKWWSRRRIVVASVAAFLALALTATGSALITKSVVEGNRPSRGSSVERPSGDEFRGPGGRGSDSTRPGRPGGTDSTRPSRPDTGSGGPSRPGQNPSMNDSDQSDGAPAAPDDAPSAESSASAT